MSEARIRVPFPFVAFPHVVIDGLARGELSHAQVAILSVLYRRANRRTWETRVTLDQLAELTSWRQTHDWLSKNLRMLRKDGWFDFASLSGRRAHMYVIRLRYDRRQETEETPRTRPAPNPAPHGVGVTARKRSSDIERADESENRGGHVELATPSTGLDGPASCRPEEAANADDYWADQLRRVRRLQNGREKATASTRKNDARTSSSKRTNDGPEGTLPTRGLGEIVNQPALFDDLGVAATPSTPTEEDNG
jgi:hypothetical protein